MYTFPLKKNQCLSITIPLVETHFLHVRFQMASDDGVHTHMLMAIPAPNIENRCTIITLIWGRELSEHDSIGFLDRPLRNVTLASHLIKKNKQFK